MTNQNSTLCLRPEGSVACLAFALTLLLLCFASTSIAQERTLTPEQLEELANDGELDSDAQTKRPSRLPDLTKGDPIGNRVKWNTWHLGPTGVLGYMVGGLKGDQIEVTAVFAGSPAEGKLQWGDVILGVNGTRFGAGRNMGMLLGKQIIEAERPVNDGTLKLIVWRDKNFSARNGKKDIAGVDIEKLLNKPANDKTLYDWKPEAEQKREARSQNSDEFPIDSKTIEITLNLEVFPEYSDTSPYDCPKAERIRENAWKVLEAQFKAGKVRADRRGTIMALALVASGKPEHRKLVHEWVRSARSPWRPPTEKIGAKFEPGYKGYKGYQSWHYGFDGLACAIYYDATGDDFVLPALRKYAIETAMGQAGGGSWGHTFAFPSFNGGKLHGWNPGYGALNAAGNRCFFLVALAQKLGIKHPEIDLAVKRAHKFFGSYVDKGGIPYGMHGAAATDDSNGKNVGVAFALKQIGDHHGAKYFAQMSTHASFTRRAGHGNDYFWHYSPWAATLCGPKGTIATHRNMRWRFTLSRRFDGGFVIQSPTGGPQELRDPTATFALHYSAPLKQTLWTGKDFDESYAWTEKSFDHLMTSALPQLNDPTLIKMAGKPYAERTTDELFKQLDMFKPKARGQYARELGKRYLAGEKEILPRLAKLLESDEPRLRGSGCRGLAACGTDATLQYMSKVARLLDDPKEFVRMQAMVTMNKASDSQETQLAFLNATVTERDDETASPNNFPAWVQNPLFGMKDKKLAESPFEAGFDEELVQAALEKLLDLDPIGNRGFLRTRAGIWSKDTVVRLAGPLTYVAENEQTSDHMFAGRHWVGQAILSKHGYHEAIQASANYLRKNAEITRSVRPLVKFKRAFVDTKVIKKNPGACRELLDPLKLWLADDPLATVVEREGEKRIYTKVQDLISIIEAAKPTAPLPSLATDVERFFQTKLAKADGTGTKIKLCRAELKDPVRKNYFRKIAAMNYLVEILGPDAIDDLVPYLGHDYWRLRQHAHLLAVKLEGKDVTSSLLSHFATVATVARRWKDAKQIHALASVATTRQAAAILTVLAERGDVEALPVARKALEHAEGAVRAAAVQAVAKLGGEKESKLIFAFMRDARAPLELEACEQALLSLSDQPEAAQQIRKVALWALPQWEPPVRHSLYWILARLGGEESLTALKKAADSASDAEFREIIYALSWSPDEQASQLLLSIIKENLDTPRANIAASEAVRRMVVGPNGINNLTNKQRLDFADPLLRMVRNESMTAYLGTVRSGRSAQILQRVMRQGGVTTTAAESIISATSGMEKATPADRKLAAAALIDAIEFIEVSYLRGGVAAVLKKDKYAQGAYARWKSLSAQAGKNLLKLDNPGKPPLAEFNDLDLDF